MKRGHIPIRTCVVCRRRRPKSEMLRFNADGVDLGRPSAGGRGLYVCRDARCMQKGLIRPDVRRRLGGLGLAAASESSLAGETAEIRLDGLHLGRVICDEGHGGCFFG